MVGLSIMQHNIGMFDDALELLASESLALASSSGIDEPNLNLRVL